MSQHRQSELSRRIARYTRTTRARSSSSCLMTAEKLLLVKSKKCQHFRIVFLSHPVLWWSLGVDTSRWSCQSQYWSKIRNSMGCVTSKTSHDRAPILRTRSRQSQRANAEISIRYLCEYVAEQRVEGKEVISPANRTFSSDWLLC